MRWVIKIGGSVMHNASAIMDALSELEGEGEEILIIPGGGIFSDLVGMVYEVYGLDEETAHWMAILSMDQYGYFLARNKYRTTCEIDFKKGLTVLLPYRLLREMDPLPRNWNTTSDAIAAWISHRYGAGFVKVTDVDGVLFEGTLLPAVNARDLIGKKTCLDPLTPEILVNTGLDCFVVNGNHEKRVKDYILGKKVLGTLVRGG